jgi:uncharacterized protein (DUF58 family)
VNRTGGPTASSRRVPVRWTLSAHARRLLTLALTGLLLAVVSGRPELAGVAAPALLLLAPRKYPHNDWLHVTVAASATHLFEGETATLDVSVEGQGEHEVELALRTADPVVPGEGAAGSAGPHTRIAFTVERWGRWPVGTIGIVLRDRWHMYQGRAELQLRRMDTYPAAAAQRTRVILGRLPDRLGEHPARTPGPGTEFAAVRPYVPGDAQRRINWPATTRRGRLQLNTFAAERAQDVIIVVDGMSDVGPAGSSSLDVAIRGAAGTARAYLAVRDRVGFISFGGGLHWLTPGLGDRQFYRIVEAVLGSAGVWNAAGWSPSAQVQRLPRSAMPPGALVIAFSPLLHHRFIEAIRELRERGFPVLIVNVLNHEPGSTASSLGRLASRLWRMEQQAVSFSLHELGIPVVRWDGRISLDLPLAPYTRHRMAVHR